MHYAKLANAMIYRNDLIHDHLSLVFSRKSI